MGKIRINKLKGKIVERGMSVASLAEEIGMDRATLYRKINENGETLTVRDANKIVEVLDLSVAEAMAIFFDTDVA